jgi:hypothetical protein
VVLLDGGRVAASGRHDDLLVTSARYREVLAAWAAIDEELDADSASGSAGGTEDPGRAAGAPVDLDGEAAGVA